jgi:hypothetical protein
MSDLLYESGARFSWYLTVLFSIFLMIFGIDLVIFFIERYDIFIFLIVSGIYGIGTILILIGVLGIFLVGRYGRKGDRILRWSIIIIIGIIPIIFFLVIPGLWLFAIICAIYLSIYLALSILDQKRIKGLHNPNPEDDLRIIRLIGNLIITIIGIILIIAGIAVNGFFLGYLPSIYQLGSYGFAFIFTGGILLFSVIFRYYRGHKEKREKKHMISKKREEFSVEWFKHQYYDLGISIQEIADELNESVINIRKRLDDIESNKEK